MAQDDPVIEPLDDDPMDWDDAPEPKCMSCCGDGFVDNVAEESGRHGWDSFDPNHDCPRCSGSGQVTTESHECYTGDQWKICPECGGNGSFD